MPDREVLISDLNDISEILIKNGYTMWSNRIQDALALLKEQEERIRMLTDQIDTITKWRANAGAFD